MPFGVAERVVSSDQVVCVQSRRPGIEHEEIESGIVSIANTVGRERAMVIQVHDTFITRAAMMRTARLGLLAAPANQWRVGNGFHRAWVVATGTDVVVDHITIYPETWDEMEAYDVPYGVLMARLEADFNQRGW